MLAKLQSTHLRRIISGLILIRVERDRKNSKALSHNTIVGTMGFDPNPPANRPQQTETKSIMA